MRMLCYSQPRLKGKYQPQFEPFTDQHTAAERSAQIHHLAYFISARPQTSAARSRCPKADSAYNLSHRGHDDKIVRPYVSSTVRADFHFDIAVRSGGASPNHWRCKLIKSRDAPRPQFLYYNASALAKSRRHGHGATNHLSF